MNVLSEAKRTDLISKGKSGDRYHDISKGRNRFERKKHSSISRSVAQYNNIDMNTFFKKDILNVGINVKGETSDYVVKVKFGGILAELQQAIKRNNNKLEFKVIVTTITKIFNSGDVYIHCTCADFQYRQAYWATKNGYSAGKPETRASNITNPNDTKGSGCKHTMLVIANLNWIMKVAAVINNYIHYMAENHERLYADLIFPQLYGIKYSKAVQLDLFDKGRNYLQTGKKTIDKANEPGKKRTQFQKDKIVNNQNIKKQSKKEEKPAKGQQELDLDDEAGQIKIKK